MPIDNTDEALTHSSRRAFLARAAAGGAVAASVGAVGLSGGLGAALGRARAISAPLPGGVV